jgi:hypothetical protein
MQPFLYIDDLRVWTVFIECFFAYFIGFIVIVNSIESLGGSHENSEKSVKKILNLLIITGLVILFMSLGIAASLEYLNISSFTIIALALVYSSINQEVPYLTKNIVIPVGCLFFVLSPIVVGSSPVLTGLNNVEITEVKEYEHANYVEIDTTIRQKKGNSVNLYVEMIPLDGIISENKESIKIVSLLKEDNMSNLHWSIVLPPQNEKNVLCLVIMNALERKQYKIEIIREKNIWYTSFKEMSFLEYLEIFYYLKLKKIYESVSIPI